MSGTLNHCYRHGVLPPLLLIRDSLAPTRRMMIGPR